jgi:Acyltransferase family
LDYLRAFVTLLVVAHHAALGYSTLVPSPSKSFTTEPSFWRAFPVLDAHRWVGFDLFVGWNDIFFMSLTFFISGIFAWRGLKSKGAAVFLKDRALRLGFPFLLSIAVLTPLAYYPAYRLTGADPTLSSFAKAWFSLNGWPSGPAWFLGVLLAFDCIAALAFVIAPRAMVWVGQLLDGDLNMWNRWCLLLLFLPTGIVTSRLLGQLVQVGPSDPNFCEKAEHLTPNLRLAEMAHISGTIVDDSGAPLKTSHVELRIFLSANISARSKRS